MEQVTAVVRQLVDLMVTEPHTVTLVREGSMLVVKVSTPGDEASFYVCDGGVTETPHQLWQRLGSDLQDWIAESPWGWGTLVEVPGPNYP